MKTHNIDTRVTSADGRTQYHLTNIRWHRNGVAGEGFYCVHLNLTEDGETHALVGILFPNSDFAEDSPEYITHTEKFSVVEPANPEACWRGDRIIGDTAEALFLTLKHRAEAEVVMTRVKAKSMTKAEQVKAELQAKFAGLPIEFVGFDTPAAGEV